MITLVKDYNLYGRLGGWLNFVGLALQILSLSRLLLLALYSGRIDPELMPDQSAQHYIYRDGHLNLTRWPTWAWLIISMKIVYTADSWRTRSNA